MRTGRRVIAFLLAFMMVFTQLPFGAVVEATETSQTPGQSTFTENGQQIVFLGAPEGVAEEIAAIEAEKPVDRAVLPPVNATVDWASYVATMQFNVSAGTDGGMAPFFWDKIFTNESLEFTLVVFDKDGNHVPGFDQTKTVTKGDLTEADGQYSGLITFPNKSRFYDDEGNRYKFGLVLPQNVLLKNTIETWSGSGQFDSELDPKIYTLDATLTRIVSSEVKVNWFTTNTVNPQLVGVFDDGNNLTEFNLPLTDGSKILRTDFANIPGVTEDKVSLGDLAMVTDTTDPADLFYEVSVKGVTGGKITADGKDYFITTTYDEFDGGVVTVKEALTVKFSKGTATTVTPDPGTEGITVTVPFGDKIDEKDIPVATKTGETFVGWQKADGTVVDLTQPITENYELTPKFNNKPAVVEDDPNDPDYVKVTFAPGDGATFDGAVKNPVWALKGTPASEVFTFAGLEYNKPTNLTPPTDLTFLNYADGTEKVTDQTKIPDADVTYTAVYGESTIPVTDPTDPVPDGYVRVTLHPGENGTLIPATGTTEQPDGTILLDVKEGTAILPKFVPTIQPEINWNANGWDPAIDTPVTKTENAFTAQYTKKPVVVDEDPKDPDYVKINFNAGDGGTFVTDGTVKNPVWALKGAPLQEVFDFAGLDVSSPKGVIVSDDSIFNAYNDGTNDVVADPSKPNSSVPQMTTETEITYTATYTKKGESQQPRIDPVITGDTTITGTGIPGAEIIVTLPDGTTTIGPVKVDPEGKWTADVPQGTELKPGDKITAVQTEPGKLPSTPAETTVLDKIIPIPDPENPIDNPDPARYARVDFDSGDNGNFGGTPTVETKAYYVIKNNTVPVAEVFAKAGLNPENGSGITVVGDFNFAKWIPAGTGNVQRDQTYTATYTAKGGSEQPKINPVVTGDTTITGTGIPGAEIVVTLPDGTTTIGPVTVDDKGNWTADVPQGTDLKPGDKITAVQTEPDKLPSTPAETTVLDKIIPITDPNEPNPDENRFVKVTLNSGSGGNFSGSGTATAEVKSFYVLKDGTVKTSEVFAKAGLDPAADTGITLLTGKKFDKWQSPAGDVVADAPVVAAITYTAQYTNLADIIPDPQDPENPIDPPAGYVTVDFAAGTNGKFADGAITKFYVNPNAKKSVGDIAPKPAIVPNTGYVHKGWDKPDVTPIASDMTVTATYDKLKDIIPDDTPDTDDDKPEGYVTVKFLPGDSGKFTAGAITKFYVNPEANKTVADITPKPGVIPNTSYEFEKWDKADTLVIKADTDITAVYKKGEDIIPDPDPENPIDPPTGYVLVDFAAGTNGKFAEGAVTRYYVNPDANKTLADIAKPGIVANTGFEFKAWDKADTTVIKTKMTVNATYNELEDVIPVTDPENPPVKPDGYVTVNFLPGANGTLTGTTKYFVNPLAGKIVGDITKPDVVPVTGFQHKGWDQADTVRITKDMDITATYEKGADIIPDPDPENPIDPPPGYVAVEFLPGANGKLVPGAIARYYVNPKANKTLADVKKPGVDANVGFTHTGWDKADTTAITQPLKVTATYKQLETTIPVDKPEDPTPKGYIRATLLPGTNGKLTPAAGTKNQPTGSVLLDVKEGTAILAKYVPTIVPNALYKTAAQPWKPVITTPVTKAINVFTAQYELKQVQTPKPSFETVTEGDPVINGTGVPGATITVKLPDGTTKTTTVAENSKWSVTPNKPLVIGQTITATQLEKGKTVSEPATTKVAPKAIPNQSDKPLIDQPYVGETTVSGKGVPGATITVLLPGTTTPVTTTVRDDYSWTVPSPTLKKGDVITATQTEKGKAPSAPSKAEPIDRPAGVSSDPVLIQSKPARYGDRTEYKVTFVGTGVAGSAIEVTLADGVTKFKTIVQPDGTWTVTSEEILSEIHKKLGFIASPKVVKNVAVDLTKADPVQDLLDRIEAAGAGYARVTQTEKGKSPSKAVEALVQRLDRDGDKLYDDEELLVYKTRVRNADTDLDFLDDGKEVYGYANAKFGYQATRPKNLDTDLDGILDGVEITTGTNPRQFTR